MASPTVQFDSSPTQSRVPPSKFFNTTLQPTILHQNHSAYFLRMNRQKKVGGRLVFDWIKTQKKKMTAKAKAIVLS